MKSYEQFYEFLKDHYLHSRFEGRNDEVWGRDYSHIVARSHYEHLKKYGKACISMYESRAATVIQYDEDLNILNPDAPPGQIQKRAKRLSSILGSGANF